MMLHTLGWVEPRMLRHRSPPSVPSMVQSNGALMINDAEPEWTRLQDAIALFESVTGYEEVGELAVNRNAYCLYEYSWFSNEGLAGKVPFKGVKLLDRTGNGEGELIPIPTEYFRTTRGFEGKNEIQAASYVDEAEDWSEKYAGGERHPSWIDVIVGTKCFKERLNLFAHEYFLGKISKGEMHRDEAERKLEKAGLPLLHAVPDKLTLETDLGKEPIQRSKKKPALGHDMMTGWAREHIMLNKHRQTTREEEMTLIAERFLEFKKPSKVRYDKARHEAANALGMKYWYAKGRKVGTHAVKNDDSANLSDIVRNKYTEQFRDNIKLSKVLKP